MSLFPAMPARTVPAALVHGGTGAAVLVLLVIYVRAVAGPPVDFGAYYGAATAIREGRGPYADALAWKAAGYVTGSPARQPTAQTAYVYPPTLALALVPLTFLPVSIASAAWLALLFGCVAGTAWCLASVMWPDGAEDRGAEFWLLVVGLTLALALFKPVRGALTFSKQVDPLIMLLLTGTIVAFARRRDGPAAILLGLAVTIKPFLVVLALWLLWKGAYRAAIGAGTVALALGLGPLLALGLLPDFLSAAAHWAGPSMVASPVSQSAMSLLLRALTVQPYTVPLVEAPWLVTPFQGLIGIGLAIAVAGTVSRSRDEPPVVLLLEWSLGLAALLIFGPLTEEHHLAYLALGLAAIVAGGLSRWRDADPARRARARRLGVATVAMVLFFLLPGTQTIAWGWYAYLDGPIRPPASFATLLFLYATLAVGALNLLALRLIRDRTR
jgi:hypothetical protein